MPRPWSTCAGAPCRSTPSHAWPRIPASIFPMSRPGRFAQEAGWTQIADRMGFVLAIPGQKPENNQNNSFNCFNTSDIRGDQGEALSIKQIVEKVKADHNIDTKRVYVTGL